MEQESNLPQNEASEIKLTAFALGELSEAERSEFLAQSLDAAADLREVAAIARLGELIRRVRREEPCPAASAALRQSLEARLVEPASSPKVAKASKMWPPQRYWLPLSLAASMLVIAGAALGLTQWRHDDARLVADANGQGDKGGAGLRAQSSADNVELGSIVMHEADAESPAENRNTELPEATEQTSDVAALSVGSIEAPMATDLNAPITASPGFSSNALGEGRMIQPITGGMPFGGNGAIRSTIGGMGGAGGGATIRSAGGGQSIPWHSPSPTGQVNRTPQFGGYQQPAAGERRDDLIDSLGGKGAHPKPAAAASRSGQGAAGAGGFGETRGAIADEVTPKGFMGVSGALADGEQGQAAAEGARRNLPMSPSDVAKIGGESYEPIVENPFLKVVDAPLSTFGIDVDTASYANVRRILNSGQLPPPDAVRIEEFINYFSYNYPQPEQGAPFSAHAEVAGCPWNAEHRLLKIGLKGREIAPQRRPASNLVFLLDVSGSMNEPNKLPLVKEAMLLLTEQLGENDRVAIVVYADQSEVALPSTSGADKRKIETAISALSAGGSTNGGQGIQTAYETARSHFIKEGVNRVILATDGDFNVGVTNQDDLVRLIEEQAKGGVFFTALGFGAGNLKDGTLEKLADKGNGHYAYIDTLGEARKALVDQLSGALVTIAKDVKVQIEFNPAQVGAFRLIGYENRVLAAADFNDDRKDAGEIGAGHAVTALYEIVPARAAAGAAAVDELKYQRVEPALKPAADSGELLTLKLRYKQPDGDESRLLEHAVSDDGKRYGQASRDFKFAAAVAAFGMLLRHSSHAGGANYDAVLELAGEGLDSDLDGYRAEFIGLVKKAMELAGAGARN